MNIVKLAKIVAFDNNIHLMSIHSVIVVIFCFSLFLHTSLASAQSNPQSQNVEIIFLAGPKDHGVPGRHEYPEDLRVLARSLETSTNISEIKTSVYVGKAPRNLEVYENASVIVINSSSDRSASEVHPLFPPNPETSGSGYDEETEQFLRDLNDLIERKQIGVGVFHYALWVENWRARGYYMNWMGGLWVQAASGNPVDDWVMTPKNVWHPILNGVKPWTYRDEVFNRFFLPDEIPGRTELLISTPMESVESRRLPENYGPQVAAWSYERSDGGRGFAFGGMDYHDNIQLDDYRKFILNGIIWAAGLDVPEDGVESTTPELQGD